ncbi:hypothetical protein Q2T42_07400 [Leptolyngbya boryana CZ1]|uniref:Uncharacterized protein n=1 Tax=Leptolyngbya boryana CZ1 TaxID=3060204 RepID=A0AA96WXE4_LEPBY|nr:hypothetical protein [Leptolyngbya boryana]WNZ47656.1 hypothetical protein Q2T42_07400 [Leptolyngbya boryana CZ1]
MNSLQALPSPWRIITQGISIYRTNFALFFRIALQSTIWILASNLMWLMVFAGLFISFFGWILLPVSKLSWTIIAIAIILLIAIVCFGIFASAKGLLQSALISRITYQILLEQPESLQDNFRQIRPQMWQLWFSRNMLNITAYALGRTFLDSDQWWLILVGFALQLCFVAEYFISDVIIAVERRKAISSLKSSYRLSKSHLLYIATTMVIAGLLLIPLDVLAFSPLFLAWSSINQGSDVDLLTSLVNVGTLQQLAQALGLSLLLYTLAQVVAMPVWQSIKAVLYQTLRTVNLSHV